MPGVRHCSKDWIQEQVFDAWVEEFNNERPHEALDMKRPAEVYASSPRPYPKALPELKYPTHDDVITVGVTGYVYIPGFGQAYLSAALASQEVGIREEDDGRWLVTFAEMDLGHVETNKKFTPMTSNPLETN